MESASSSRAAKLSRDTKIKTKGRGHTEINEEGKYDGRDGVFESIGRGGGGDGGPLQCEFTDVLVLQIALNSVQLQVFVINSLVIDMLRKTFRCIEVAPLSSMNKKIQDIFVWKKQF
jgi:hypothetical protein